MDKLSLVKNVIKIANAFDIEGFYKEADVLTRVAQNVSEEDMTLEEQLKLSPQFGLHPAAWKDSIEAHHEWRLGRGIGNPRMKPTGEVDPDGNKIEEDITRPYHLLSRKNQLLTSAAIENAYRLCLENPNASIDELASGVHDFWVEQNQWMEGEYATDEQKEQYARLKVPFNELPEDEKQKDRVFVMKAKRSIEGNAR